MAQVALLSVQMAHLPNKIRIFVQHVIATAHCALQQTISRAHSAQLGTFSAIARVLQPVLLALAKFQVHLFV